MNDRIKHGVHRSANAAAGVIVLLLAIWAAALGVWTAHGRASPPPDAPLRLNPNTAGPEALALLPGIGRVRARAIVEYRKQHAGRAFGRADDLRQVRGIGPKTVSRIAPLLRFDPPQIPATQDGHQP